jgi:YwiC-like protein
MTPSQTNLLSEPTAAQPATAVSHAPAWYYPIFSPEHGVYVMLFVSFLTGAAASQQWTWATTLAFICAFAGFQAEHPLTLQIKQRRSWKPRFVVWGSLYAGIALGIAVYLSLQMPMLLWLYLGAIAAFLIDAISVFYRQQKSLWNELLTFAAVCLAAPFAAIATTGTGTVSLLGLWLLNTLFFGSAIFTVKLRKSKTPSSLSSIVYHAIATLAIFGLWYSGWLTLIAAIAFGVVLLKFGLILWQLKWYKATPIQTVALLETFSALLFLILTAIALLPVHPLIFT